jgi:type II secretory pathway component GspD/PulD (secretin)
MKRIILILSLALTSMASAEATPGVNPATLVADRIRAKLDDPVAEYRANGQPVREVLEGIGRYNSIPIIVEPDVQGDVTFTVYGAQLRTLLDAICAPQGWSYEVVPEGYLVVRRYTTRSYPIDYLQLTSSGSSSATVTLSGGSTSGSSSSNGTIGGSGSLTNNANGSSGSSSGGSTSGASSLSVSQTNDADFWARFADDIKAMLAKDESAQINKFAGLMQVRASLQTHARIESYCKQMMERVRRQVLISVRIVRIDLNKSSKLGVDWNVAAFKVGAANNTIGTTNSGVTVGGAFSNPLGTTQGSGFSTATDVAGVGSKTLSNNVFTGIIASNQISAMMSVLAEQGNVTTETKPEIATLNNVTAFVQLSEDSPFFTRTSSTTFNAGGTQAAGTQPVTSTNFSERVVSFGNLLEVTPQISNDDEIQLALTPSITDLRGTVTSPDGQSTSPRQGISRLRSIITLRDGETYIMGGFISTEKGSQKRGIPGLSDIPYVGNLFGTTGKIDTRSELAVFVTAHIRKVVATPPSDVRTPAPGGGVNEYRITVTDAAEYAKKTAPAKIVTKGEAPAPVSAPEPVKAPVVPEPAPLGRVERIDM